MDEIPSAQGIAAPASADSLEMLIAAWDTGRRARGGWWALAGFSFQSAVYLQRFFEGLEEGASPAQLARTELLSDVLFPENGVAQLIQVKRTLTGASLRSAVREAYAIATLCSATLLKRVRFRIACLYRATSTQPSDLDPYDVIGPNVVPEAWNAILESFGSEDAIWVEPDPFDRLHDFLWTAGVVDTAGFIDACLGILLRAFEHPNRDTPQGVALALAREFRASGRWRRARRDPIGIVLAPADVRLEASAVTDTSMVFNRRPLLSDLTKNRFRLRAEIFSSLVDDFETWWKDLEGADDATTIPIFWISGRSGEGKSVLLLQLMQHVLLREAPPNVTFLRTADELPAWIERQRERQHEYTSLTAQPSIAVVDDLQLVTDYEGWDAAFRRASDLIVPRVAILACGPSTERERFEAAFATVADVRTFPVPNLDKAEMARFAEWFAERNGVTAQSLPTDSENRLLVIWIFELVQGKSIAAFAASFRTRLRRLGVFDLANSVLAANAVGRPAPAALLEHLTERERDAFGALCSQSQLHFAVLEGDEGGIALAHPQISWLLFREWVLPPATVAKALGRALASSLVASLQRQETAYAAALLFNAQAATLLGSQPADAEGGEGILEMIAELNAKVAAQLPLEQRVSLLPRWLDVITKHPDVRLAPSPVEEALQLVNAGPRSAGLTGYLAGWLWRVSDLQEYQDQSDRLRQGAETILLDLEPGPDVTAAISMIARRGLDRSASLSICRRWLGAETAMLGSGRALAPILAGWPQEADVADRAMAWLERNLDSTQAYTVMVPLLASRPKTPRLKELAIEWLYAHRSANEPVGYYVLETLIAVRGSDREVLAAALDWVKSNPLHPWVRQLLQPLLAKWPGAEGLRDIAEAWVLHAAGSSAANSIVGSLISAYRDDKAIRAGVRCCEEAPTSEQLYYVLIALLSLRPPPPQTTGLALAWLSHNGDHASATQVWSALIAATPGNPRVVRMAAVWAEAHIALPTVYWMLAPLLKADRQGRRAARVAISWLRANPRHDTAYWLLSPLVAARPNSREVRRLALDWLDAFPDHPQAQHLYSPLVAARPRNRQIQRRVRAWLERQQYHPKLAGLVETLILRSDGAAPWMEYGERYLAGTTEEAGVKVLVALTRGSKANPAYLDRVFDRLGRESDEVLRRNLRRGLGRALVENMTTAQGFLAGDTTMDRKRIAANAMATALQGYTYVQSEDLTAIWNTPRELAATLLSALVASSATTDSLSPLLRNWLELHWHAPGYGAVLRSLKHNAVRWKELLASGPISARVIEDYHQG